MDIVKTTPASTKQQLLIFFVATYGISWTLFFTGKQLDILPLILLGVWSPTITSLILTRYFYGTKGLRQLLGRFKRIHIKWYWWAALLFLPALIHFTGVSLWQLVYTGDITPRILDMQYWLGAIIPSFLIAGFGEELGWRGFALPRLQRHFSPILASVILAFVHLFWHLPTYWLGQGIHNVPFVYLFAFVFAWTFVFNWLYNKSGGSLLFTVGFHAISNASLSIVSFMPWESQVPITPDLLTNWSFPVELAGPYLTVCLVYILVAVLIITKGKFNQVNTDLP